MSTQLFSEFNASEEILLGNLECYERSENLHSSPNSSEVEVRLFIFFAEEDRLFISSIFKVRIFISNKRQPPQNQMVVPETGYWLSVCHG